MASAQWNVIGWNPYSPRDTSGDSTFVLSAPSRIAIQNGVANWTPSTSGGASYLVYTALLTQSGTDAPVATVLENTLGGTVVWSYVSTGTYRATLSGAFTSNKTVLPFFPNTSDNTRRIQTNEDGDDVFYGIGIISTSVVEMSIVDGNLSPVNAKINNFLFEIRVYP